jgi:zinc protease
MGWGTKDYFCSGRYNLAEAFFLNNQALVRDLREKFPAQADIQFNIYDHRAVQYLAAKYKLTKDSLGLLWDRDVVAFYGDPAWDARMPAGRQVAKAGARSIRPVVLSNNG